MISPPSDARHTPGISPQDAGIHGRETPQSPAMSKITPSRGNPAPAEISSAGGTACSGGCGLYSTRRTATATSLPVRSTRQTASIPSRAYANSSLDSMLSNTLHAEARLVMTMSHESAMSPLKSSRTMRSRTSSVVCHSAVIYRRMRETPAEVATFPPLSASRIPRSISRVSAFSQTSSLRSASSIIQ